jgi:hypothetical protein
MAGAGQEAAMREHGGAQGQRQIGLHWTIAALVLLVQVPASITMVWVDRAGAEPLLQHPQDQRHRHFPLAIVGSAGAGLTVPLLPADMPAWRQSSRAPPMRSFISSCS